MSKNRKAEKNIPEEPQESRNFSDAVQDETVQAFDSSTPGESYGIREEKGKTAGDEETSQNPDGSDKGPAVTAAETLQEEVPGEKAKTAALESEISELKDLYLRKQADFENFRKRMLREREESIRYANSSLLMDIVAIIDDFERAIKSAEESKDFESFHSGIVLIEKQFVNLLERKWGLKRLESIGEEFDPERHEAIGMEPSADHEVQTVVEDYQKGYLLHDRVLRHAKVKVAMPAPRQMETGSKEAE